MHTQKGVISFQIVVCLAIVAILAVIIGEATLDNMSHTKQRAEANAKLFLAQNKLETKIFTCAGDSDGDGYGTCSMTLQDGSKLQLECSSRFMNVTVWGDTSCKEKSLINLNNSQLNTGN